MYTSCPFNALTTTTLYSLEQELFYFDELSPAARSKCPSLGSAPARLFRLLRALLAALGSLALPG